MQTFYGILTLHPREFPNKLLHKYNLNIRPPILDVDLQNRLLIFFEGFTASPVLNTLAHSK